MRLVSVELNDFRSFFGRHLLEFSHHDDRRVTLFHGENGAGKTNLLNAIHWCFTGKFTPRFQDRQLLVNKEAFKLGRRECCVELIVADERDANGVSYRVRRTATNDRETGLEVFKLEKGNSTVVQRGQGLLHRMLPAGLISWFFFDAEAIGALELSGSESFRQDLRKTLGFDLVDTLIADLEAVHAKRRREVATQTKDKDLKAIEDEIDGIDHVLPGQRQEFENLDRQRQSLSSEIERVRSDLELKPKAEPLERERRRIEGQIQRLAEEKRSLGLRAAQVVGAAAPACVLLPLTQRLEGKLHEEEVRGRLPAPYSDQLVKDILEAHLCICGRPVQDHSPEAAKISDLLKFASTSALNQRISDVRYLIRDIERQAREFPEVVQTVRSRMASIDVETGRLEEDLKGITKELQGIDQDEVKQLEMKRIELERERDKLLMRAGALRGLIDTNERKRAELKQRYEVTAKRLAVNQRLKRELDKTARLIAYIRKSADSQEAQALQLLSMELNLVLDRYLTKHYRAQIDPKNYAVQLLDKEGRKVGHSTGEGQVLKFAFIAAVVAMAAKKTQQKIEWLSEPTIAPLVLDAPFSALDPEYQGSVAKNLAAQTTQLILMISSAAWGPKVESALEPFVGKRYLIVSKEAGEKGEKPVKTVVLKGRTHELNEYGASFNESVFQEVQ